MSIFTDYKISSRNNGTIDKLVVVRVFTYQFETKPRVITFCVGMPENGISDIVSNISSRHFLKDFMILAYNLIANTQDIPTFQEGFPGKPIRAVLRYHLHETIRVDNDVAHGN